ncbi:MAG TPA: CDP-alcohol phosphatidyltransferase family protein [Rhodanobacteraceae bacterium]|nr:CDP-alcohol phosphatidyltransferase family protein [Rhodanobacteraceae bacterium]
MARPAPGFRTPAASPWRHLPNAVSVLRIALVAPVILAIEARSFRLALILAVVAGVSDGLDGWLARHFHWRSRLGSVLDPLADKLLLVACFVVLTGMGKIPVALTALVLGRDFIIAAGAWAWHRVIGHFRSSPSWISKCCTAVQILYVLAVLVGEAGWLRLPMVPWIWLVAALTLASGLDYIVRWGWMARRELAQRRQSRGRDES